MTDVCVFAGLTSSSSFTEERADNAREIPAFLDCTRDWERGTMVEYELKIVVLIIPLWVCDFICAPLMGLAKLSVTFP